MTPYMQQFGLHITKSAFIIVFKYSCYKHFKQVMVKVYWIEFKKYYMRLMVK